MVFRFPALPRDPSKQIKDEVGRRRLQSFSALNRNDVLVWKGPSLYPNSLAPRQSSNPDRRAPIDILLSKHSPSRAQQDHQWRLILSDVIRETHDPDSEQASQIWRCKVSKGDSGGDLAADSTVVLKLYYPGLYRQQGPEDQRWTNEHGLSENEAIAYERFKHIQGIDVPFCYGFYNFDPLVGPRMIGVVLEDLRSTSTDLHTYTSRARIMQPEHEEHRKFIDRMLCECTRTLYHLNSCNIALQGYVGGSSILLIQPPTNPSTISESSSPVQLVFVGFGHTHTQENVAKMSYRPEHGEESVDEWLSNEAAFLRGDLCDTFGHEEVSEWREMEDERGLLFEEFPYLFD